MKRARVLLLLSLSGCFGFDERLAACRRGELGCGMEVADAGTTCPPIAGNLLNNGSFERVSADGGIPGWTATPPLVRHEGGAAECGFWAEQTSATTLLLENAFDLGAPLPAETLFELGFSARALDGNAEPLIVDLRIRSGGYRSERTARLNNDGTWTELSVQLGLIEAGGNLKMSIYSDRVEQRSVGIDRVFVRRL